ncbi:MAG TPA: thioesterase family protein [Reyranella sp.]|nr:thioesterase family protein [Reyranella sp.]
MKQIPLGATGTATLHVQPEHLANRFKDASLPPVFATPVMILVMENAALNAIKPFLEAGESAVGIAVDVKHVAATPVGQDVRAMAEVVGVNGKRIDFKVTARDSEEEIGRGTHQRIVIDLSSFNARLTRKGR